MKKYFIKAKKLMIAFSIPCWKLKLSKSKRTTNKDMMKWGFSIHMAQTRYRHQELSSFFLTAEVCLHLILLRLL